MKKILSLLLTFLVLSVACQPIEEKKESPSEPQNIGVLTEELLTYYNSGTYMQQLDSVAADALRFLESTPIPNEKGALVLDIDDTSITNAELFIGTKFCPGDKLGGWILAAKAPAIESIHALYTKAQEMGLKVIFITARDEGLREVTVKNLAFAKYENYDTLILKEDNSKFSSSGAFKTSVRKTLEADGYSIVLNVGDQESDTTGGFARKAFKLPNPFYYTK